jgi:hypothetical protein
MKTIINESLQALQICVLNPKGNNIIMLGPRQSMTVHANQISQMMLNLANRKVIKII